MQRSIRSLQIGVGWFPEQPGNGLDRVYYGLAEHLPDVGVPVRGLVVGTEGVGRSTGGRIQAFATAEASLQQRLLGVRTALRADSILGSSELVASHFALFTLPIIDLVRKHPLVVHFHGPWTMESIAEGERAFVVTLKALIERVVYARADHFIVLSEAFRDVLVQRYGVSENKVSIVPGGVDFKRFDTGVTRGQARERLGWPTDRPIVLSVRRLVRRVGLEALVASMVRVRRRVPKVLLLIGGKGPLAVQLDAQIRASGLEKNVRLLGFIPDEELPLAYRAADISVVPTAALEGFGLIAAESLAAGTPALVTPIGGLPEVVRDLEPTLVLPGHEADDLASGIVSALRGDLALPDAAACQQFAENRYAWPVVARSVREVYEELL